MLLDLISPAKLKRAAFYALYLILCFIAEEFIFSRIAIAGIHLFFLPAVVLTVGFFEGGVWGGVFGLIAGLLTDFSYLESTVTFTVVFTIIGFFGGVFAEHYVNRRFFSYMFTALAASLVTAFAQALRPLILGAAGGAVLKNLLLQSLFAIPFSAIVYFPGRAIARQNRKDC